MYVNGKHINRIEKRSNQITKGILTFMTGAQKCTVLMPTSLSHAFLNQLADCCCSPDAVLCHRLPCWRNWLRNICWAWLLKKGEGPAAPLRKSGRAARKMLLVGAMAFCDVVSPSQLSFPLIYIYIFSVLVAQFLRFRELKENRVKQNSR